MLRVSAVATALVLLLAACSHEDDRPDRKPTTEEPKVAALEIAWQTPAAHAYSGIDEGRGDGLWSTPEQVAVIGERTVTTYDVATGEQRAEIALPGYVCAVAADVNDAGVGAVVVGKRSDGVHVDRCATVVAVDTLAGKVRWRARVRESVYLNNVSIGDKAVAVTDVGDGARRLRVRDGRRLPALGSGPSSSNGTTVVASNVDDTALQVFDQDSGALVRTVPVPDPREVGAVLTDHGRVLAAVDAADGFAFRDLSGTRSRSVGRQIDDSFPRLGRTVAIDGQPIVQYGDAAVVDRWNPATRRFAWLITLDPMEVLVGTRGSRLVTVAYDGNAIASDTIVRTIDPSAPADPLVVGAVEGTSDAELHLAGPLAAVGDLLVAQTNRGLTAFRIPTDGVATSSLVTSVDGVVTAQQVADLCRGLRPATLRRLGYQRSGAPVDCVYYVRAADDVNHLQLRISGFASEGEGDLSAVEQATATFTNTAAGDQNQPVLASVTGVGDQAAMDAKARVLLVRRDNVVLHLQLTGSAQPARDRRVILKAAARDLLAELERRTR